MTLSKAAAAFLDYKLYVRRVRPQSIFTYRAHLRRFMAAVGPACSLAGAVAQAESFMVALSQRGRSDAYARKTFVILKDLATWSCARGYIRVNPLHDAKPPMVHERPKVFLTRPEVAQLLAAIRISPQRHAVRDHALVATLYYALLRIGEALAARPEDFDLETCTVRILGKGGKLRLIPFHPRLRPILLAWRRDRPAGPTMFPSRRHLGGPTSVLGRVRVELLLREIYGPAAGLGRRVTPHALRRSGADHLYSGGADLGQIKGLLRHNSVTTTMTYLNVETPANLRGAWGKL